MRRQLLSDTLRRGPVTGYSAVCFFWLNYATHANYWLPYRNILFE